MTYLRPLPCVAPIVLVATTIGLLAAVQPGMAEEEEPEQPSQVQAVLYEIFHGDSLHRYGSYVREIHIPERGFSFSVVGGELRVFKPQPWRYLTEGSTITIPGPGGERIEVPFHHLAGTAPRRIREFRIRAEDANRFEELLRTKTRLRALADGYLLPLDSYEFVVGYPSRDNSARRFVDSLLEEAGITWVGVGNAGGDSLSVPAARAEEARRLLRDALKEGLASPPADPEREPHWDLHLEFRVLDREGRPEWYADRTKVPPVPPNTDVLHHLSRFPGSEYVTVDGKSRYAEYGDHDLEQAEKTLQKRWPRPWTVEGLVSWYAEASALPDEQDPEQPRRGDGKVRAALLYLLAASRNARAVPLLGNGLADDDLDVRVAATYGILTYWDEEPMEEGGLESAMDQAGKWWEAIR